MAKRRYDSVKLFECIMATGTKPIRTETSNSITFDGLIKIVKDNSKEATGENLTAFLLSESYEPTSANINVAILGYEDAKASRNPNLWQVRNANLPRPDGVTISQIEKTIAEQQKIYELAYRLGEEEIHNGKPYFPNKKYLEAAE